MDQAEQLRKIIKAGTIANRPLARVFTVTSGKGGVGKSNTAINLAIQFRKRNKRVIILDADFGLANIEIMFGTVPKYNLCDLIYQGKNIREIITWGPMDVGFISGGSGITGLSNLSRDSLTYIVQRLSELDTLADIIIIDTGAGVSDAVMEFLVASGEILLVATPEPTSITDAYSLLKVLSKHHRFSDENTKVSLLANKVKSAKEGEQLYEKLNSVISRYLPISVSYLGSVPEDDQLFKAVMQQSPVSLKAPQAKSALAYEEIATALLGEEKNKAQEKGMAAFMSRFLKRVR